MKKIYKIIAFIAICFLAQQESKAQTEIEIDPNGRSYSQIFDSLTTGLIPSRIPYGTLYDRVYGWSGLEEWSNSDTLSLTRFFQAWFDAEESVINAGQRPHRYDAMHINNKDAVNSGKLPLLLFQNRFAYFDTLAMQDGRLSDKRNYNRQ